MKDLTIVILSTIAFFVFLLFILIGIQKNIFRLPVYFNPDGTVINVNRDYKDYWGHRLSLEDVQFAKDLNSKFSFVEHEVRIYDRFENVQMGRFFFKHIDKLEIIRYFFTDIATSLLSFVAAIWFFYYIRDIYIFLFFVSISSLILANFLFIAFETFHFFVIFSLFFTSFNLFNLSFRFRGKEIPTKWLIPQIVISAIMGFIVATEKDQFNVLMETGTIGLFFIIFSTTITKSAILYDIFRHHQQFNILKRKFSLLFSFMIIFLVPLTLLTGDPFSFFSLDRLFFLGFFIVFLVSFIYGTYRYSLVPVQFFFSPTITTFILVFGYVGGYLTIAILLNTIGSQHTIARSKYFNLLYLFVTIIYLIQARVTIRTWVNYYSFRKNENLSQSLEKISNLISSPVSMRGIVNSIQKSMVETLNVNKIVLLLPGEYFSNIDLKSINFTRVSSNSEIWKFFQITKEVVVTSHLAYGVGFREILFNYLTNLEIQIAFPIRDLQSKDRNKAILLIGEKVNKQNFTLGELRYIREVARLASMLIDNYSLLADEIEKKKIIRKLHTASILDNTLNLTDAHLPNRIKIGYISLPAVEISGDYLDFISVSQDRLAIFLGDVSGHGLGTGYLVTAIKALTRELVLNNHSLEEIFELINLFLKEKYGGNEFMTLIGGILDTRTGMFEYINAGHPGMIAIDHNGNLTHYNKTQRVLGILNTKYYIQTLELLSDQKFILYSDGITETFNRGDLMFGDDALFGFLRSHARLSASELPALLEAQLTEFRSGMELSDDTTFVALELHSPFALSDNQ